LGASLKDGVLRLEVEDIRDMAEKWDGGGDASKKWEPREPKLADDTGRDPGVNERSRETLGCRNGRARSFEGVPFIPGESVLGGVRTPAEDTDTEGMWSEKPSWSCGVYESWTANYVAHHTRGSSSSSNTWV
jgi:hypothetical protein